MVSNKNRLYIAVYPSGILNNEELRYHWAFLMGPKKEKEFQVPGIRFHVRNTLDEGWIYEESDLEDVRCTERLLARIVIAKIEDEEELVRIFREAPVINDDPNWYCQSRVADVLGRLAANSKAVGTANLDWGSIEPLARSYVAKKSSEGRYVGLQDLTEPKPTWDIMKRKETVP